MLPRENIKIYSFSLFSRHARHFTALLLLSLLHPHGDGDDEWVGGRKEGRRGKKNLISILLSKAHVYIKPVNGELFVCVCVYLRMVQR